MDLFNELKTSPDRSERSNTAKQIENILMPIVEMDMAYLGHYDGELIFMYNKLLGINAGVDLVEALSDYVFKNNPEKLKLIISRVKKAPENLEKTQAEFVEQVNQYTQEQTKIFMAYTDTPNRTKNMETLKLNSLNLIVNRINSIAKIKQALESLNTFMSQKNITAVMPSTTSAAANLAPEPRLGLPGNLVAAHLSLRRR